MRVCHVRVFPKFQQVGFRCHTNPSTRRTQILNRSHIQATLCVCIQPAHHAPTYPVIPPCVIESVCFEREARASHVLRARIYYIAYTPRDESSKYIRQ